MGEIVFGLVASGAVLAAWDAARRYIAAKELSQREIDRIIAVEFDLQKQRELIDNLNSKLNAVGAAQATRTQRIGGLR